MSNFLNQFDKNNYNNYNNTPIEKPFNEEQQQVISKVETVSVTETHRHDVAIHGPVHSTEVDRSFHRNRIIKLLIITVAVIAVCITGFFIFRLSNRIDVTPLVGKDVNEAKSWSLRNRIELDVVYEFNLENKKDIIITQYPESDSKVQRGSIVSLTVSNGPDPDEIIQLPDFSMMETTEVRKWKDEIKASNVNIIQEYSDTVEDKKFIKFEFRSDLVNESNYTRKDMVLVYMSRGEEPILKNITVPDLKGKLQEEIETWATTNKVKLIIEKSASETVDEKRAISQSVKAGERLAADDEITVEISLGVGVAVPDFNTVSMSEATTGFDLEVEVEQRYNDSVAYGRVISQSVAAGTKLYGSNNKVKVVYSVGKPFLDNLVGKSEKDLPSYFYEFKSKGANITYTKEYVDSSQPKGTVVYSSHGSEYVDLSLSIHVQISLGNLEPEVPETLESPQSPDNTLPEEDGLPNSPPGGSGAEFTRFSVR